MNVFSRASRQKHYMRSLSSNLGPGFLTTGNLGAHAGLACDFQTCKLLAVHGRKLSAPPLLSVSDVPGM